MELNERKGVAKTLLDNPDTFSSMCEGISGCLESKKDWATFESFLDVTFNVSKNPFTSARLIERVLSKNDIWNKEYLAYCTSKSMLADYVTTRRSESEFEFCKTFFDTGRYQAAIPELDKFIGKNKGVNRNLSARAMLMKGQCYIQLGEMDKAVNQFSTLTVEYPDAEYAPEANFFAGYCHMLQGKFKQAKEALNLVVKDYPQSSYANKAKLCLMRIESMTE